MKFTSLFFKYFIFVIFSFFLTKSLSAKYSNLECFGITLLDIALPGAGYAVTGQFDKSVILGIPSWSTQGNYLHAREQDGYQENIDDVYKITEPEDTENGKLRTDIYMNRETWDANYYGALNQNLTFIRIWDLSEHRCEENTETYLEIAAPFNIAHFYDKWTFWLPMAFLAYNYYTFSDNYEINYYLGNDLTEDRLRQDGFLLYYSVGVGEEMIFRGSIQKTLYHLFQKSFSPSTSRHLGIFSAAAIFGIAHNGKGFSANAFQAFLYGIYQGYVYQSDIHTYDLTTAIAIHSWYDIILFYTFLNHANFEESKEDVNYQIPITQISFQF